MNAEDRKKCEHVCEILRAALAEEIVEFRADTDREWVRCDDGITLRLLINNPWLYRVRKPPVTRQWCKPADIPGPVCYLRSIGYEEGFSLIIGARQDPSSPGLNGILLGAFRDGGTIIGWHELNHQEHSTDLKTWHPCTVTEEAK